MKAMLTYGLCLSATMLLAGCASVGDRAVGVSVGDSGVSAGDRAVDASQHSSGLGGWGQTISRLVQTNWGETKLGQMTGTELRLTARAKSNTEADSRNAIVPVLAEPQPLGALQRAAESQFGVSHESTTTGSNRVSTVSENSESISLVNANIQEAHQFPPTRKLNNAQTPLNAHNPHKPQSTQTPSNHQTSCNSHSPQNSLISHAFHSAQNSDVTPSPRATQSSQAHQDSQARQGHQSHQGSQSLQGSPTPLVSRDSQDPPSSLDSQASQGLQVSPAPEDPLDSPGFHLNQRAAEVEGSFSVIGLEELLSLAFANNPAIQELAATTQIAAGYRTQVGLYANPLMGYQGLQLADEGTDQHLFFVQQKIITGGKLGLNRAVLNEAVRAQLQELEAQKMRVATDIKTVYYDCLRIQQQLEAIDQFSKLLQQGVTAAEKRMQAGEGSKIDLLQTQVQFHQLELDRRQLAASLDARLREIMALAGMPQIYFAGVTGELPNEPIAQDWGALEEGLVASSPEYIAAQARIRQASAAIRRHEIQPLPNLEVEFGAGVDNSTNSGMINVQVGAPIPVFNKNEGNIAAVRAEYCRTLQEAQRIDNSIRARLAVASGEYARAAEAVRVYAGQLLPAAHETLELAEAAYKVGEQDFIQLLVTRRTYFDTNLAYIAACAQLASAQAQIDGYLLTGALNSVINNSGDDSLRGLTLGQE